MEFMTSKCKRTMEMRRRTLDRAWPNPMEKIGVGIGVGVGLFRISKIA